MHADPIAAVAAAIVERRPRHVVFTARGTSDHAALYGAYLAEIRLGLPAGLASPSAVTVYGARPDLSEALVVGVCQSGGSPDLAEVVRVARETGALTLAITNNPESPLAGAAELHIDVAAGHERAVAATKTYTAELLALLLLVEGIRGGDGRGAGRRAARDCRRCRRWPRPRWPTRRRPSWRGATGSRRGWSPPGGATRTRPPARPRSS